MRYLLTELSLGTQWSGTSPQMLVQLPISYLHFYLFAHQFHSLFLSQTDFCPQFTWLKTWLLVITALATWRLISFLFQWQAFWEGLWYAKLGSSIWGRGHILPTCGFHGNLLDRVGWSGGWGWAGRWLWESLFPEKEGSWADKLWGSITK